MSKDRNIDDSELANISGAGGGDVTVEATSEIPGGSTGTDSGEKPPAGGGGGGAAGDIEADAEGGGNVVFGPND